MGGTTKRLGTVTVPMRTGENIFGNFMLYSSFSLGFQEKNFSRTS